jgi:hypothetical protein
MTGVLGEESEMGSETGLIEESEDISYPRVGPAGIASEEVAIDGKIRTHKSIWPSSAPLPQTTRHSNKQWENKPTISNLGRVVQGLITGRMCALLFLNGRKWVGASQLWN